MAKVAVGFFIAAAAWLLVSFALFFLGVVPGGDHAGHVLVIGFFGLFGTGIGAGYLSSVL